MPDGGTTERDIGRILGKLEHIERQVALIPALHSNLSTLTARMDHTLGCLDDFERRCAEKEDRLDDVESNLADLEMRDAKRVTAIKVLSSVSVTLIGFAGWVISNALPNISIKH